MKVVKLYGIYDRVAGWFPFFMFRAMTDGEAIRFFRQIVQDPNSQPHADPMNYILYELGTFDQVDGRIEGSDVITQICTGASFVHETTEEDLSKQTALTIEQIRGAFKDQIEEEEEE